MSINATVTVHLDECRGGLTIKVIKDSACSLLVRDELVDDSLVLGEPPLHAPVTIGPRLWLPGDMHTIVP